MSHARSPKVHHHHHHHHHQQQQQQQQTASPNHSVAHTGVKRGRRALLEQVDPTLSLPLDRSRWLIVGVRPLRNPPFARRLGGPKGWVGKEKKRKGKERRRPPLWSQMPRREEKGEEEKKKEKSVCVGGWMRKFRARIDGRTPTVPGTLSQRKGRGGKKERGFSVSPIHQIIFLSLCDRRWSAHGKMTIKFVVILLTLLLAQGARWVRLCTCGYLRDQQLREGCFHSPGASKSSHATVVMCVCGGE